MMPVIRSLFDRFQPRPDAPAPETAATIPAEAAPIEAPVILNSDDEALTPRLVEWLLGCVFTDAELLAAAISLLGRDGSPVPENCATVNDLNRLLFRLTAEPLASTEGPGNATSLQIRLHQSVVDHLGRVKNNRDAYLPERQNDPAAGFWPDPSSPRNGRSLLTELPYRQVHQFITRDTPICSAGSCFAVEIAHYLQNAGYRYVITEPNPAGATATGAGAPADSSAAWGIIFNTPSFRQLVERAFGLRTLPRILWSSHLWAGEQGRYMDPFREGVEFETQEAFAETYDRHVAAARQALSEMRVFIVTLGLNEVWTFRMDGSVFSRSPWRIAPSFVEHRTLTVQENVDELQRMLDVLRRFNPDVKLIVTLSPVPLHATFLHRSAHVVEANLHSKSVLRVAAQHFVNANRDVFYFPSFELVTTGLSDPWDADQRHVRREAVARVMDMFREMYIVA